MHRKCEHKTRRTRCRDCGGGTQARQSHRRCEHNRQHRFCKECKGSGICKHNKRHCLICTPNGVFRQCIHGAKRRGYDFVLTLDEFKSFASQPCFYCGQHDEPNGIDRWDNKIGYVLSNCRPCCITCNKMKLTMGGAAFVEHIQRAADYTQAVEQFDSQQQF